MTSDRSVLAEKERQVQAHYNAHPVPHHVASNTLLSKLMSRNPIKPELRVVDIGCGQGAIARLIRDSCGARVFGIDITPVAAAITLGKGIPTAVGSNLSLPVSNSSSDVVISNGVIQITPDARRCFRELVRILKPGGYLYLSVYKRGTFYDFAYHWVGGTLRALQQVLGVKLGNLILKITVLPWFYLASVLAILIFQRHFRLISWSSIWDSFNDQLLAPIATFYSEDEILSWASEHKLECIQSESNLATGWMLSFWFRKQANLKG